MQNSISNVYRELINLSQSQYCGLNIARVETAHEQIEDDVYEERLAIWYSVPANSRDYRSRELIDASSIPVDSPSTGEIYYQLCI